MYVPALILCIAESIWLTLQTPHIITLESYLLLLAAVWTKNATHLHNAILSTWTTHITPRRHKPSNPWVYISHPFDEVSFLADFSPSPILSVMYLSCNIISSYRLTVPNLIMENFPISTKLRNLQIAKFDERSFVWNLFFIVRICWMLKVSLIKETNDSLVTTQTLK